MQCRLLLLVPLQLLAHFARGLLGRIQFLLELSLCRFGRAARLGEVLAARFNLQGEAIKLYRVKRALLVEVLLGLLELPQNDLSPVGDQASQQL